MAAGVAEVGGAVVPRRHPPGIEAPTLLRDAGLRRSLTPLVQTYGTVPYADVDPTWPAWVAYVLMFGMMFGDAGQGIFLVAAALALRAGWPRWARRYRRAWPFVGGAGVAATGFGLLYGECFGPTGLVPTVWLDPLSHPTTLLLVAAGIGVILLALAYGLGAINRWREGGWPVMLYAPSGIAGICLFLGAGAAACGWYLHHALLVGIGALVAVAGLALALIGFLAEAGGGGAGTMQASVEAFDFVVRLGSNVVSFTRLAAFGLTHAASACSYGRHTGAVGPWRDAGRGRGGPVRRRDCAGVQPGGVRRRHPGIAPGVLRIVLARLRGTRLAVQAMVRAHGDRPRSRGLRRGKPSRAQRGGRRCGMAAG